MSNKTVLVTGGAGYIGSHVVRQLGEAGENVVTLDNMIFGHAEAVLYGDLVQGDTGDRAVVEKVIKNYDVDTIMHFAAYTAVPESVSDPLKYYHNNTCSAMSLIQTALNAGVKNFVFSSTAAVYGIVEQDAPITESAPLAPINPYGLSKLMTEQILRDTAAVNDFNYVAIRYFNVAGADPQCRIGAYPKDVLLLIKAACEVAVGKRPELQIFGTDYPTPDGTGIRDYIHVEDIASAHVKTLDYLRNGGESAIFNCGYGHGYSVREVLNAVQKVHGKAINIVEKPRRAGDPPSLIADSSLIREKTGWQPAYDNLEKIVEHALNWEKKLCDSA
ncbi:MAG: UDP-glucose 4-epimerase GalE [Gammaproteobacteria bacterium]|nr:UDP-glucose 4-epimerase GalE [Gammaproteobacteria bacterium]